MPIRRRCGRNVTRSDAGSRGTAAAAAPTADEGRARRVCGVMLSMAILETWLVVSETPLRSSLARRSLNASQGRRGSGLAVRSDRVWDSAALGQTVVAAAKARAAQVASTIASESRRILSPCRRPIHDTSASRRIITITRSWHLRRPPAVSPAAAIRSVLAIAKPTGPSTCAQASASQRVVRCSRA